MFLKNLFRKYQHYQHYQQEQYQQSSSSASNGKPPGKSKSRLHISLGRLGLSKQQNPSPEPARLRDITEIRIANPTFTHKNISARNYDAFFESGEPVYKLEHRRPVTQQIESNPFDMNDTTKRPHSFGLFSKMTKSKPDAAKLNARSRSSDPSMVSEKGDRCHSLNDFLFYLHQLINYILCVRSCVCAYICPCAVHSTRSTLIH